MTLSFDAYNPTDFGRLRKAIKANYREMEPFRKVRRLNIDAAAGHYYRTEDQTPDAVRDSVNTMDQYQRTLVRFFAQNNPKSRITSRKDYRTAAIFQEHLNQTAIEINLVRTLRRCIQESILGYIGIAYCGYDDDGTFVDPISLPDYVVDMSHDDFKDVDFEGHRFSKRIGELRGNEMYDQEVVGSLRRRRSGQSELDDDTTDRSFQDEEEGSLFDWVDIWAINVKPANAVVYMSMDDSTMERPLRVESLDAPEFGPYVRLGYDEVLDELMFNSPAAMLLDLHEFINSKYRRIFMDEDQAAKFWAFEGSEEDARALRNARNGEVVQIANLAGLQQVIKGGTNPQALATGIHARRLFDEMSGNLRMLAGVGPIAETATQERLANANISRMVRDMQRQVINFTRTLMQNVAWLEWTDPIRTRRVEIKVGKNGHAVQSMWKPEIREGDFIQHEIDINPDSLEHRSSAQQLEALMRGVREAAVPAMTFAGDRPVVLKGPELVEKYAKLGDVPELREVVGYALDEQFVSQPATTGGAMNAPAQQREQPPRAPGGGEDAMVESVLRGALSGNQQEQQ